MIFRGAQPRDLLLFHIWQACKSELFKFPTLENKVPQGRINKKSSFSKGELRKLGAELAQFKK
jgi:hypothetical protein